MSPEEKAALSTRLRGGRAEREISLDPATRVIAVASGKGGVGKSSLTVNLAAALDPRGQRVGLLDLGVYGHSLPHMLGLHQRPIVVDKMIVPPVRGGLRLISIGNFLDDNSPVMWRGPMLHRALEQFLSDVHWGELDTLVVDMPPGTGDMAISLGQLLPRAEVLLVTTPQPPAQQVAVRAALMAQRTGTRVIGVVENMSWLVGTGQGSSAPAAARRSLSSSTCRCSARCRSTRCCARPPTREPAASSRRPTRRPPGDHGDRGAARDARARCHPERRSRVLPRARRGAAAAFFDLDRTLLRRSSALALAGTFREHGLSAAAAAKAALWQLLFAPAAPAPEPSASRGGRDAPAFQRLRVEELRELVAGRWSRC